MEYLSYLQDLFEQNQNAEYAQQMSKYMRNQFQFYGINSPHRTEILKQFLEQNGLPKVENLSEILQTMWEKPQREWQYCAMNIFQKIIKNSKKDFLPLAESLIIQKSWWDTIDVIAPHIVGEMFLNLPEKKEEYAQKWSISDNMWLKRTSIIFQLNYKTKTNTDLLEKNILLNIESKEFFIQKAIGWALRQYARTDKDFVKNFVASNQNLANLSKREALKRL